MRLGDEGAFSKQGISHVLCLCVASPGRRRARWRRSSPRRARRPRRRRRRRHRRRRARRRHRGVPRANLHFSHTLSLSHFLALAYVAFVGPRLERGNSARGRETQETGHVFLLLLRRQSALSSRSRRPRRARSAVRARRPRVSSSDSRVSSSASANSARDAAPSSSRKPQTRESFRRSERRRGSVAYVVGRPHCTL